MNFLPRKVYLRSFFVSETREIGANQLFESSYREQKKRFIYFYLFLLFDFFYMEKKKIAFWNKFGAEFCFCGTLSI